MVLQVKVWVWHKFGSLGCLTTCSICKTRNPKDMAWQLVLSHFGKVFFSFFFFLCVMGSAITFVILLGTGRFRGSWGWNSSPSCCASSQEGHTPDFFIPTQVHQCRWGQYVQVNRLCGQWWGCGLSSVGTRRELPAGYPTGRGCRGGIQSPAV